MKYTKHVSEPWFTFIKDGIKTVEGRLNKGSFAEMKKGDIIVWITSNSKIQVKTKIVAIHKYKTFYEYLQKERLKNTLPNVNRIKKGESIYYQYYSKEDEKKYGVLAIRLKLI